MKILHLEFGRHVYGGALQVAYLLRGLSAVDDVESHLVVPEGSDLPQHIPDSCSADIHQMPIGGEADFRVFFRLKRLAGEVSPDILHIHSRRGADLWGILLARHLGLPYVLTRRVDNADARWLTRWRTAKANYVVGISRRICEVMESRGTDPEKIRCILSTVDTETYSPGGDRRTLLKAAGVGETVLCLGMIAQLIERKGHRVLFKAIPKILKAHPQTVFLIFGRGPLEADLHREVESEPWADRVHFMGFRTDIPDLLPALDLVIHPAFMEGLGVSLLQASACGVPIVACEAGGIPEVVENGVNGLLVEPGNHAALGDAIIGLLGDAERRKEMGRAGRRLAEERFSIQRMSNDYLGLYREIVKMS